MELVVGKSLADEIANAPVAPGRVADIGAEIAAALAALHRQKVVHLDLKPENVMLTTRGVVLLDFGLAHHAELPDLLGEESSVPMGSAAYISPEQVLGERGDPASDIFALGCILYQLASGEEPFGRPSTTAGMKRRLYQAPPKLREIAPKTPRWLEAVIERCMEVDRSRRYGDAEKVLFDLRNPEHVVVPRQRPHRGQGWLEWFSGLFSKPDDRTRIGRPTVERSAAGPAIILAAVDLTKGVDPLAEEVLAETARVLSVRADSRLACVSVLKTEIIGDTPTTDAAGKSVYVQRLVALKDWARGLGLPDERISYHVIEAVSPANAILNYAGHNGVGHIVIGARGSSALRRHLGSVSTEVVAEALCSVSVVRVQQIEETAAAERDKSPPP
jgi:serine/threonine protein kinase